ncbi:dUTP diphosphatase [Candidatus Similichlamydia epinepheli]|uniref:dUTP diphosphatase n=1 Tax=Candidatus Similichlamydia epinepheli TaxID=1903953 RepID=UPI000D35CAFE|nr:dUTP diphosphatase [Candidatus Similichlamydia epinepheli]
MKIGYVNEGLCSPLIKENIWNLKSKYNCIIRPGEISLIPTGFFFDLTNEFSISILSHPKMVMEEGLIVINAPGTVDSDFRGEVCGIVNNVSNATLSLSAGDVFALGILERVIQMKLETETRHLSIQAEQGAKIPSYQTSGSAGFDLAAFLEQELIIHPKESKLVETGLQIKVPKGIHLQMRSRSGLSLKSGIVVLGAPIVITEGEHVIVVPLYNSSDKPFLIRNEMRIAQIVCIETIPFECVANETLTVTGRGAQGFGSTGV